MMSLAACLSCLAFFVKLVEDILVGAIPDTFQESFYRMKIFIFSLFFCFSNNLYIHCHPYHYPHYMSLAMAESLPQSPLFFIERLWEPQVSQKLVHQFSCELSPFSLTVARHGSPVKETNWKDITPTAIGKALATVVR